MCVWVEEVGGLGLGMLCGWPVSGHKTDRGLMACPSVLKFSCSEVTLHLVVNISVVQPWSLSLGRRRRPS